MTKQRVITAIFFVLIFGPIFILGSYFTGIALSILAALGTYEIVKLHNTKHNLNKYLNYVIPAISFVLCLESFLLTKFNVTNTVNIVAYTLILIFVSLCSIAIVAPRLQVKDAFFYLGTIVYVSVGFSMMSYIRCHNYFNLSIKIFNYDINASGLIIFLYVLCCSMFTDVFAYFFGIKFGKHKLAPVVSPNKSVEGFICGVIFSAIVSTAYLVIIKILIETHLVSLTANTVLFTVIVFFVSLSLAVVSQVGDLIASKLKREYEIKDYSNIFPGHGGVMDRFDSLLLVSTISFVLLSIIGVL